MENESLDNDLRMSSWKICFFPFENIFHVIYLQIERKQIELNGMKDDE